MNQKGFIARGFTLVELTVVIGIIVLIASLVLPGVTKLRQAAQKAVCQNNLRQMGNAWTIYTAENKGHLMDYIWFTPKTPDIAWNGYWPGILAHYDVKDANFLCPKANTSPTYSRSRGYGEVDLAWTGKYSSNGTAIRFNASTFKEGSYGINRYLTATGEFTPNSSQLTTTKNLNDIPLFMDCAYVDVHPLNGTLDSPVSPPPNLKGTTINGGNPEHWNILLARHGRGINVCMADGSVRWIMLDDLYMLTWTSTWIPMHLDNLPKS